VGRPRHHLDRSRSASVPLIKATIKKFAEYCQQQGHTLHRRNFSIRFESNIPRQVGLAGSSAIVVATLRCLMDFYQVQIPKGVQPSLVLAVEAEELGITAGLQDRVIQVFEGLVYMDFARERMQQINGYGCGAYERLDPALLPQLYLAWIARDASDFVQPTYAVHTPLRVRFQQGEPAVIEAMKTFARLAEEARAALLARDHERLAALIDSNFDVRRSIMPQMLPGQIQMVEAARSVGASAHFAGSGGAILGTYRDQEMFEKVVGVLAEIGCRVEKPLAA
jgi:glucuronokinase